MRILILGGDGYLGWPQALYLSARGHEVAIFDNLMRRQFDEETGFASVLPIESYEGRVQAWTEVSERQIRAYRGDMNDYPTMRAVFEDVQPEAVVHYAEQRSAPYSMIDREHAYFTQQNNVLGTLNVLYAIKEVVPDSHLVKLGTMGEYGTPNIDIEEGYLDIEHKGRKDRLPYPKQPGSFYHLTKVHDSHNILFCCRIWGMRATDLNQGVVYGFETPETKQDTRLETRFDYDQVYGTALNRFCAQAAVGHAITPYGSGKQTRGYINILDTMRCIELAIEHPANAGECRVFNQITEQFAINELAEQVARVAQEMGLNPRIAHLDNPRVEAEEHYYNVTHTSLLDLGLEPHLLTDAVIQSLIACCVQHRGRIDERAFDPTVRWRSPHNVAHLDPVSAGSA
jgi:UDP-sulfoquinovose synthase